MKNNSDIFHSRNYLFLNFIVLTGYLFLYPIITKKILPSDYGNYIFAHSIALIVVGISSLGLKVGYKRNFFELYKKKRESEILLFTVQIFALLVFSIVFIINKIFEKNIISNFGGINNIENFWSLLILALMFDSISKYYLIFLENKLNSKKYFLIIVTKNLIYFSCIFLLLFKNYGVKSLLYSLFIANAAILIFVILSQIKNSTFHFNKKYILFILKISIPNTPKILFGQINSKIDKILIGSISTFSNVGIYTIAQSMSYIIFQITTSVDKVFITKTNKMLFNNENSKIGPYLTSFIYFCSIPAIGLILFNDIFLHIIIDEKYHGSENVIIILSIYYFSLIFSKIASTQLVYAKKVWLNTNFFILNVVLNIILNIPMIFYFGLIGAALATLFASTISIILVIFYAKKYAPISYEKKKIFIILLFIFFASLYSIIVKNDLIIINSLVEHSVNILIVIKFLLFGYFIKIFDKTTLKKIIKI